MEKKQSDLPTILIADDHDLIAEMVESNLLATDEFATARASSYESVIASVAANGSFDVILLDLDMPGMNGLKGVESVVAANANGAVVLFSGQARQEAVFRAIELGVKGFIPKTIAAKSLKNAIRFVLAGDIFIPSSVTASMARAKKNTRDTTLSAKEMDVLRGICRGDTNKDIARALGLSEITVKVYVRAICTKLNVTNRTQVAVTAISRGLY